MDEPISGADKRYYIDFSVIIAFHIAVRLMVYSKLHFVYGVIINYMQYLDPIILRHNLLVSLRDLHIQPPLFNAFLGLILKLFPEYPPVFSVLYFVMGLVISCLSYLIVMHLTKRRLVSIAAACVIASFPPLLQADRWLFYPYPVTLLLLCACFLIIHIQKNIGMQIFFIAVCATIVLMRSFFHLIVWLVPMISLLIFLAVRFDRRAFARILAVSLLAWILSSVPYFRNYARYGMFTSSTFQGQNIAGMITHIRKKDITDMISQGRITPLVRIKRFSDPEVYFAYFKKVPQNGSIALDAPYKFSGKVNWNNEIYALASKEYQQNTLKLIKAYPYAYLKAVLDEFYIFFGTEPYRFWRERDEWLKFRRDSAVNFISDAGRLTGIPLLIFGMYAAALAGFILRISKDVRRYAIVEIVTSRRCEIFILFNLIYTLLTANLFEVGEGCFMRMPIDSFLIIGSAVFITDCVPGFFEIYRWSGESQEVSGYKNTFIRRIMTAGTVIFFAGLCVWNIYVVFHGPMFPGEFHNERYNKIVKTQEEIAKTQEQAIRINPDDAVAYNNLAVAYGELGRYLEAAKALKQAIRIKPDDAAEYYNLGMVYNGLGRWRKAVKAFEQAIDIKPDDAEVYCIMSEVYNKLGCYREAIDALEQALQLKPDYSEARQNLVDTRSMIKVMKLTVSEDEIHKDPNKDKANDLSGPVHK